MLAGASDIPHELFDNIIKFFELDTSRKRRVELLLRNRVFASKRELGSIALVCRRWATFIQPAIFQDITLRRREDVLMLLSLIKHPRSRIAGYINEISIALLASEYPSQPWVHIVYTALIPKLPECVDKTPFAVQGPLPAGRFMKSIHHQLPSWAPVFSRGIRHLELTDLQFKHFGDLVRLLREIPLLEQLRATNISWGADHDGDGDGAPLPAVTSYLCKRRALGDSFARPAMSDPGYVMSGCTDNGAAGWLPFLVAPTWAARLAQHEVDALCQLASVLVKDIDADAYPDWKAQAYRDPANSDKLTFLAESRSRGLVPEMSAYVVEPAVPGLALRVGAFVMHFRKESFGREFSDAFEPIWKTLDTLLTTDLSTVDALCLVFDAHESFVRFRKEVVDRGRAPGLIGSPRLKYVVRKDSRYVRVRWDADVLQDVGRSTLHWEDLLYV